MMDKKNLTQGVFLGDPQLMGKRENDGNVTVQDPGEQQWKIMENNNVKQWGTTMENNGDNLTNDVCVLQCVDN